MNLTSPSPSGAENSYVSEDVKLLLSSDEDTVDDIVDMVGSWIWMQILVIKVELELLHPAFYELFHH